MNKICILLLGDSNCGKTTFCKTLELSENTNKYFKPTIGVNIFFKNLLINDNVINIKFFEISGNKRFSSIINTYLNISDFIFLFFSYDNYDSYKNISYWKNLIGNKNFIIIGTKSDLIEKKNIPEFKKDNEIIDIDCRNYQTIEKFFQHFIKENIQLVKMTNNQNRHILSNFFWCFRKD